MGGLCSRSVPVDNSPGGCVLHGNGHIDYGFASFQPRVLPVKAQTKLNPPSVGENMEKHLEEPFSSSVRASVGYENDNNQIGLEPGEPQLSRAPSHKSRLTKLKPAIAGKIGTAKASLSSLSSIMLCVVSSFYFSSY